MDTRFKKCGMGVAAKQRIHTRPGNRKSIKIYTPPRPN